MPEFIKKLLENISNVWSKISNVQKIISVVVIVLAVLGILGVMLFSTSGNGVPLFTSQLPVEDFDRITSKLTELKVPFTTKGKSSIYVANNNLKNKTILMLAESGFMPRTKYGFLDIIKSKNITSSKFENDIKLRQAVESKLEEMLRSSEFIDDADVSFTMPEKSVFTQNTEPVKVAVLLTPKYGIDLKEYKNIIKGYQELILNSIDRASRENVVITNNRGEILNDFSGEDEDIQLKITKENLKIREQEIDKYRRRLYDAITRMIPDDRLSIVVDVKMNFDKEKESRKDVLPVVLKQDDPNTPYDDGERTYSISVSKKTTKEEFKGPNWIPEGPPGFDTNVPPAYKGALEQITQYVKSEDIDNQVYGESNKEIEKDPWEISQITASVQIDGSWEIEYDEKGKVKLNPDGTRKRKFIPVDENTLKSIKGFVENGIGFSVARGDKVSVFGFQKDRSEQFLIEDAKWKRQKQTFWVLVSILFSLLFLIIGSIIYRVVMKELERRRRLRDEELALQHQLAREMALKNAEEESAQVEMSMEDKARLEMQENAINLAREHPEDVAQLIRTWLSEE